MNKKVLLASTLLTTAAVPVASMAEMSANIGWVSEYIFRGVYQEDSSASAGFDYANDNGFYLGTWGADVGDGLETDFYFGYGGGDDFTYSIGYTAYRYTDDFDGDYDEINLGIGYGIFALDVALGEYDPLGSPITFDYTHTAITISPEKGPYYKLASFSQDFDGTYFEVGYGFDFMGVDLSIAATYSGDAGDPGSSIVLREEDFGRFVGPGDDPYSKWALVFGITKGFDVGN